MFRRMIAVVAIVLLATVLLAACAPATTPAPEVITETVIETVVVEVTPVPVELGPEPIQLTMWSEWCAFIPPEGCETWNDTYCDGTVTKAGDIGPRYVEEWHKLHPEYSHVDVKCIIATYGGGRIGQELTAMVRAGEGPNIYTLYGGRSWLAAEIGIDLDKYLTDEDKAAYLDYDQWVAEDGTLLVLPGWGVFQYPVANKQLIERACAQEGFDCEAPGPWSIMPYDEYLEIAEAIKALDDGSYMGVLWGSGPSSQQLNWLYFAQAGIPAFKDGEFTGFEGGEDVLTELLRLYDEGYLYPDVAGISDGDGFPLWARGKVGIHMARLSYGAQIDNAVDAGECEPWDMIPLLGIEFREGVTPLIGGGYYSGAGFVADNTPEEYREPATSFMTFLLGVPWGGEAHWPDTFLLQHVQVERKIVSPGTRDEALVHIDEYGLAEDGIRVEVYNLVRGAHAEMLTAVFLREVTPEEGLAQFQARVAELQSE